MTNLMESPEAPASQEAPAEIGSDSVGETEVEATSQPEATEGGEATEPEYDILDTSELGDKHVKVKVDGEEIVVPLSEALAGYSRTEDYTRKRQADAEALRLARAVQNNPGLTMQALAAQAGMSVEQFLNLPTAQQQQIASEPAPEDIPPTDPFERQLWEQDRRVAQLEQMLEQQRSDAELQQVVAGLKQQYGASDEDVMQAVQAAVAISDRTQRPVGPEFLPMIYQSLQYNKMRAAQQAQEQHSQATAAEQAARQAAAAEAAQVVTAGQSANGTTNVPVAGQPMTAAQAVEAALEKYGIT